MPGLSRFEAYVPLSTDANCYGNKDHGYLEWTAFKLTSRLNTTEVTAGLLQGWHHTPSFKVVETHEDNEIFCFLEGPALMSKEHFVAVAEDTTYKAVVVSPVQAAPKVMLPEIIAGI
ncbi:hypothetical protein LQE92_03275 [Lacrimispora sp. NSJ-141]|uniref:Uncharacterized protein n=1 Tax=Lientehia hominis TaxID=2897778 RepID=A0AAP2RHA4_9FIRM|nr:hypothetical protein [Lientehia hominis]MCD2491645.1 hypothetical protein [Lientehia hominis]